MRQRGSAVSYAYQKSAEVAQESKKKKNLQIFLKKNKSLRFQVFDYIHIRGCYEYLRVAPTS